MSTSLTRRGLVAAVPSALVAATLPALAVGGDDHLLDLYRRLAPLNAIAADADRRVIAAEAIYDRMKPDVPEALIVRSDDEFRSLKTSPEMRRGQPTGRFHHCIDVEKTKEEVATFSTKRGREILRGIDPRAEARLERLREMADSAATWQAARQSAWAASGVSEAQDAAEEAHTRCREVLSEIARRSATTLAGVMLKTRAAAPCFGDTLDEAMAAIGDEIDEGSVGESLALSILKDLLRITRQNAAGGFDA